MTEPLAYFRGRFVPVSQAAVPIYDTGFVQGTTVAEQLRTAIKERFEAQYVNVTSTFKSLEDGTETVLLDGRQMATAIFTISVQFKTAEDKPAQPQRHSKK